jgi:DNA repair protein RAD7
VIVTMTVLRSREIVPTKPTPKVPKAALKIEPSTPSRTDGPSILQSPTPPMSSGPNPYPNTTPVSSGLGSDSVSVSGVNRRRSLRLSSKSDSGEGSGSIPAHDCKRKSVSGERGACLTGNRVEGESAEETGGGVLSLAGNGEMSSDLVEKRVRVLDWACGLSGNESGSEEEKDSRGFGEVGLGSKSAKGKKRKLGFDVNLGLECAWEDVEGKGYLNLRSGKRLAKRGINGVGTSAVDDKLVDEREGQEEEEEEEEHNGELGRELIGIGIKREGKGKGRLVHDDVVSTGLKVVDPKADNVSGNVVENEGSKRVNERRAGGGNEKGKRKLCGANDGGVVIEKGVVKGRRRFSREEKGKGVVLDGFLLPNDEGEDLVSKVKNSVEDVVSGTVHSGDNVASQVETEVGQANARENQSTRRDYMERFREIARESAPRFALFTHIGEGEDLVSSEAEAEREFEDWPGPFSTAMKIIKDRATKNQRVGSSYLDKSKVASVTWVPRDSQNRPKRPVPSLKELSLKILAKNADEIKSLENIPDALKHKLSHLLCDSRRMNNHSFELLVHGSPREVRLRDCSWLTEEQFTKSFQKCDTSNLMVCLFCHMICLQYLEDSLYLYLNSLYNVFNGKRLWFCAFQSCGSFRLKAHLDVCIICLWYILE